MCKTSCWGAGAGGCDDCKEGWDTADYGCFDINECLKKPDDWPPCGYREYCLNTPGSFKCVGKCKKCSYFGLFVLIRLELKHIEKKSDKNVNNWQLF